MSLYPVGAAIRSAIINQQAPALQPIAAEIGTLIGQYRGVPAVFAFRPEPDGAPQTIIQINEDTALTDEDGLTSDRPTVMRDVVVYGKRGAPGSAEDDSARVERAGYLLRELFHRQKWAVQVPGYSVTDVQVFGPVAAPVDDEAEIGRLITLTIRLRRQQA